MQRIKAAMLAATTALFVLVSGQLFADDKTVVKPLIRPDANSVSVPKIVSTSDSDYFYFYKLGVSYEKAFSDLDECRIYSLSAGIPIQPPDFVPLGSDAVESKSAIQSISYTPYGLIGVLIAVPFIEGTIENAAEAADRRCMVYKGYSRYGTTRAVVDQISKGTDEQKLARLAIIASGSQPLSGAVGP